ncbi:MAG TPA: hypothetical protein PLY21_14025, partial [Spirochaetota bacterium]|nr:hypothetical protein [Spirochaetota bacterium]
LGSVMLYASSAFASYIDQLSNQSAEWLGNPTRTAATDSVDGVVYNPAGLSTVADGLYVHYSQQAIDNNVSVEVMDPYAGNAKYATHKPSKFVPSFYTNYKQDNWAVFGGFSIFGGGGSVLWENGAPNLNFAVQTAEQLGGGWLNGGNYFGDDGTANGNVSVEMLSMLPALTFGGSVAVNDVVSVALGGRVIKSTQSIELKATESGIGGSRDKIFEAELTALGYHGIIGVNVRPVKELNFAVTYESQTELEYEVDVKTDMSKPALMGFGNKQCLQALSGYEDGRKIRFDLPAKLQLGAEYAFTETFKASVAFLYYFTNWGTYDKPAKANQVSGAQEKTSYDLNAAYEAGIGFDWEFLKGIHWTAGVNYDCMNMKKDQISETMTKNDLWNVGTGLKVRTAENLNLMVSYMHNFYNDVENNATATSASGVTTNYKTKYEKYANVFAFSIEYKFL